MHKDYSCQSGSPLPVVHDSHARSPPALCGGKPQQEKPIDGLDASALLLGKTLETPLHDVIPYYQGSNLDAVRRGKWKLYVVRHGRDGVAGPILELYDLVSDPSEMRNVAAENQDTVAQLQQDVSRFRLQFGDAGTQTRGTECRPIGRVDNPVSLTHFDPTHPYYMAMYDINEAG